MTVTAPRDDVDSPEPTGTDTGSDTVAEVGAKARRGLSWSLIGTLLIKVGSFGVTLVVARLLVPSDYGSYAVALAALHFVMHVHDAGLIAATVQWRGRIEEMSATAQSLTFGLSAALYVAFWFLAEPFARLAGVPEAAGLVRLITVNILIHGVTAVSAGVILREFQQDKLIKANAAGFVVSSGVTIGLAVAGAGPYALAYGHVAGELTTGVLMMLWGRVRFRFGFDRAVARRLLAFGLPLAGALAVEAVLMNADYVIVGNLLGEDSLGFYLMAFNISSWIPSIVGTAVSYVSLAGFSRLSEKDTAALQTGVERSVPALLTLLIPVAVLIAVLAAPMLAVLYGSRWIPSAAVLSVLMGLTVVRMLTDFALDILSSAGATRPSLWVNLAWAATLVPALLVGTRWGGAVGAAVAHVVIGALVALPLTGYALHRVGVRLRPVGRAVLRPALAGLLTLAVCLSLAQFPAPPLARLVIVGLVGVAVFGATGVAPQDRQRLLRRLAPLTTRLVAKLRPAR